MTLMNKDYLVEKIYQNIVKISRSKFFYIDYGLDDSFETRFDLVIFHSFMIFYYYKSKKIKNSNIAQDLFDYMFNDFENNLREMGFGDIAVNKKMKAFIRAFYGRLSQYSKSLDLEKNTGDKTLLEQTILNNIYKGKNSNNEIISLFTHYMIKNVNNFINKSESENLDCNFEFLKFS
jgi:cytochrome b pre-mRNA-processing protein 3